MSFNAPELVAQAREAAAASTPADGQPAAQPASEARYTCVIDKPHVERHLSDLLKKQDLSKYIL